MILDGWGQGNKDSSDAIFSGNTPNIDKLMAEYPNAELMTSGEVVGLPEGQMGNSEVGHLTIGAGRVVYQDLVRINIECRNGNIAKNPELVKAYQYAKENNKAVHLLGLVSDGGVHSMDTHIYKLCDVAKDFGLKDVFIHALMDGRDCDPRSGAGFIFNLEEHLKTSVGKIATVGGRYYTMDRDKRWERVKVSYDLLVNSIGTNYKSAHQSILDSYADGITDEFIKPIVVVDKNEKPLAKINEGDVVICFNFRTDRLREITTVLTQKDMPEYNMKTIDLYYVTMTSYDDSYENVHLMYEKDNISNSLGEIIANNGLKQLRIAETEKYPHVTFFFSGGRESEFENEKRVLIPSPKVATYDLQPEMSAYLVKDAVISEIENNHPDFICLNFANGDMVGHTGIYPAILKAVETVDDCVNQVINVAIANDYDALIIADHGNADFTINEDGSPNTAHSLNPVPSILVSKRFNKIENGILADVAPTILKVMGVEIPKEMTGKVLVY